MGSSLGKSTVEPTGTATTRGRNVSPFWRIDVRRAEALAGAGAGKGGTVASRLYNASRLVSRAPAYRFVLGRNIGQNTERLLEFLRRADA